MKDMFKFVAALCVPLLLSGCLLIPGKFDSKMVLKNDGQYTFFYNGEMQIFSGDDKGFGGRSYAEFDPDSVKCSNQIDNATGEVTPLDYEDYASSDDDTEAPYRNEARECSKEEIAARRAEYEDANARHKKEDDEKAAMMGSMFGGAVPGDDESLKKFAEQLSKYDGWNKVKYVGNNLFEVEYAISGRFDQTFSFPSIPSATMQFPFVQIIRRKGRELEILTPAMAGPGGLFGAMAMKNIGDKEMPEMSPIEGTFVIETDGEVLTNNSADGYVSDGTNKSMTWNVGAGGVLGESPRAIVKLAQ
ncbi:MAG: hypothetical protein V7676_11485 [Parasphingorhabdus sp.]|uniref:hypothetical protein n=1 Tax=Parasphingorhabdus sp. TaxID=2709688 RepID=UPI00300234F6